MLLLPVNLVWFRGSDEFSSPLLTGQSQLYVTLYIPWFMDRWKIILLVSVEPLVNVRIFLMLPSTVPTWYVSSVHFKELTLINILLPFWLVSSEGPCCQYMVCNFIFLICKLVLYFHCVFQVNPLGFCCVLFQIIKTCRTGQQFRLL